MTEESPVHGDAARSPVARTYRYYDLILGGFVATLLCSDLIGVTKVVSFKGFTFGAGILFFPLAYVFGDVLTEVYGYARARRVVWSGFAALMFAALMSYVVVAMPPSPDWHGQAHLDAVFGSTPRIAAASLIAYCCGEFSNSYVLAKVKLFTRGRMLWLRTIGSTVVGEAVDSLVFYPLAFWGKWEPSLVLQVMATNYCLKVAWEVVLTPVTYRIVAWLKAAESEDHYDWNTDFSPFHIKT